MLLMFITKLSLTYLKKLKAMMLSLKMVHWICVPHDVKANTDVSYGDSENTNINESLWGKQRLVKFKMAL